MKPAMKSRLTLPEPGAMTAEQREIFDSIVATRGNVSGPFLAWMLSPGLAAPAEKLGAFCRYQTGLALVESELLILVVAAAHRCTGEQQIHEPIALQAGLPAQAVQDLREGRRPALATPRLQLLERVAHNLLHAHRIDDALYTEARGVFGEQTLVEVVGVIGYYALVACTLNAFEMRLDG